MAAVSDGAQLRPGEAFSQENVTPPEKPYVDVARHLLVADAPVAKVSEVGEHVQVSPGAGVGEADGDGEGVAVLVGVGRGVGVGDGDGVGRGLGDVVGLGPVVPGPGDAVGVGGRSARGDGVTAPVGVAEGDAAGAGDGTIGRERSERTEPSPLQSTGPRTAAAFTSGAPDLTSTRRVVIANSDEAPADRTEAPSLVTSSAIGANAPDRGDVSALSAPPSSRSEPAATKVRP